MSPNGLNKQLELWQSNFTALCRFDDDMMRPVWSDERQREAHFEHACDLAVRIREELTTAGQERIVVSWLSGDGELIRAD